MYNFGDILRKVACHLDERLVQIMGRPLKLCPVHIVKGRKDGLYKEDQAATFANPVDLIGFYEIPGSSNGNFSLDLDEMDVELAYNTTFKKVIPRCGDMIIDCTGGKWVVVQRDRKDDLVRGQNRLRLRTQRYHVSETPKEANA